jgi:glycosyltransferase involved in cell wall biosynthesis
MKIAQVAPLYESVPPKLYGGTERVVSYLTEALVDQGHEVTLFASGDSETAARLVPVCSRALRLHPDCVDKLAHHVLMLQEVMERARNFDIVHFHIDYLHFPMSRLSNLPQVSTLHGRLDLPDLISLYKKFSDMPLVSISMSQREPLSWANWVGNVHHGIPRHRLSLGDGSGRYLAFLGRISPEKRVDHAIEIAHACGLPLKIAAKVDPADCEYFNEKIKPLLNDPRIEYIGEIPDSEKAGFLGKAHALLFPVDWPEPFGLAMIESMACGTPVIAFRRGAVAEVVRNGVSGFVVDGVTDAVRAVRHVESLSRAKCRVEFEQRFTSDRMADDYVKIYSAVLASRKTNSRRMTEVDTLLTL